MEMDVRRVGWVVVFTGVAMAALGLVSLGEWAPVARALHQTDVAIRYEQVDDLTSAFGELYDDDERSLQRVGLVTLAIAVAGLMLSRKFPRLGGAAVALSLMTSVAFVVWFVRYGIALGEGARTHCGPFVVVPTAHDFIQVRQFAVLFSFVAVAALWRLVRSREALISGALMVVMFSVPLWLEAFEARVVIIAAAFFSVALTRWFEVAVPRFGMVLMVPLFVAGAWSTVVVAHDARAAEALVEGHRSGLWWRESEGVTTFAAERCEETPLTPMVHTHEEISISGRAYQTPLDATKVTEQFEDLITQREALGIYGLISMNIEADRQLSLADFFAVIRGFHRVKSSTDFVTLTFMRTLDDPLWSRPSMHAHNCGLQVVMSEDGLRERDFANFEALFDAAARGGLKLSVE